MLQHTRQQVDLRVLLLDKTVTEEVCERECAERSHRVNEQRVRAVERMDVAAAGNRRPPPRLHRAAHLERELVEADFPFARIGTLFTRHAPERAVGAHVVEPVIVHAHVREVRRHAGEGAFPAKLEEFARAGCVKLQQRRPVLKSFCPFRPAARRVLAVDREHRGTAR
jgi:hypothetical protein